MWRTATSLKNITFRSIVQGIGKPAEIVITGAILGQMAVEDLYQ